MQDAPTSYDYRPLLALDRTSLRLSSPRGEAVGTSFRISNRGQGHLVGTVGVRVGGEWLRVSPASLSLSAGQDCSVEVQADPSGLAPGLFLGEIDIITNGGDESVGVRLGLRTGRSWAPLALALVAAAGIAAALGLLLAGVTLPAAAPSATPVPTQAARSATVTHEQARMAAADRRRALAAMRVAVTHSNALWRAALSGPSTVGLDTVKTGHDLAGLVAEVEDLLSNGEHWQITPRHFLIRSTHLAADGRSGWADVEKSERRTLYGPDKGQPPLQQADNTYLLRYFLVNQGGRWLVDSIAVRGLVPNAVATGPALSIEQIAARTQPSIMHVEADSTNGGAVGTGFVVASTTSTSYVVTNDHVVSGAQTVKLQRWLDGRYQPRAPWIASKLWEDAADDLAVIRVDQGRLPVLPWGNSDALPVGEQVVAIGYAENLYGGPTVTMGIVSSLQRTAPDQPNGPFYIGHSATINHGNSGGPLLDLYGRVVGINTWTLDNTQGLFFAIPSTRAARVAAGYIGSNG